MHMRTKMTMHSSTMDQNIWILDIEIQKLFLGRRAAIAFFKITIFTFPGRENDLKKME